MPSGPVFVYGHVSVFYFIRYYSTYFSVLLSAYAENHACVPKCTSACRHGLWAWMNA